MSNKSWIEENWIENKIEPPSNQIECPSNWYQPHHVEIMLRGGGFQTDSNLCESVAKHLNFALRKGWEMRGQNDHSRIDGQNQALAEECVIHMEKVAQIKAIIADRFNQAEVNFAQPELARALKEIMEAIR